MSKYCTGIVEFKTSGNLIKNNLHPTHRIKISYRPHILISPTLRPMHTEKETHIKAAQKLFGNRFIEALKHDPIPEDALCLLAYPGTIYQKRLTIPDTGKGTRHVNAWRLRCTDLFGPSKGGVRFHSSVNESSLSELASRILIKCAVNSLPHGGAAGGVSINSKNLSQEERKNLATAYVSAYVDVIGSEKDILSPDLGTDMQVMRWMSTEFNRLKRTFEPAAINGKPVGFGGIAGRHTATAKGCMTVLETLFTNWGESLESTTCTIQGFGAAGSTVAIEAAHRGMKVIAVSDSSGGWFDPNGLPIDMLATAKSSGIPLSRMDVNGATRISPENALEIPADWVIAAALGGQVHGENAPRLKCRGVVEIANGAVSNEGELILHQRGIKLIPDVVVNAGGITVSHLEWVQGRQGITMDEADVTAHLEKRMKKAATRLIETADIHKVTLPVAAQLMALERIRAALII